jgi:hypothetical protein
MSCSGVASVRSPTSAYRILHGAPPVGIIAVANNTELHTVASSGVVNIYRVLTSMHCKSSPLDIVPVLKRVLCQSIHADY